MKPSVKLEKVTKLYQMGQVQVTALVDVSLTIFPGEFIVILGPSGSGKTTMLNLLGGLDYPTSGLIEVNGIDISTLKESELTNYRRTQVGFIFQFFNLIPTLTARENVEFAGELIKQRRSAKELLNEVGLEERIDHFPSQLSGGIARSLATDPAILLCDEPTGSLDFETGKRIFKLLRVLNDTRQKTMIVVTHNSPVGEIADRVIRMHDGRISRIITNEHPLDPEALEW